MKEGNSQGSVTLMVLAMLLVFGIIFGTLAALITRQSNQISMQEENEQATGLADAGVQYAFWILKPIPGGGGANPVDLCGPNPPAGTSMHVIVDAGGVELGYFDLEFESCSADFVRVQSRGVDYVRNDICQLVTAEFARNGEGVFQRVSWNAHPGSGCEE